MVKYNSRQTMWRTVFKHLDALLVVAKMEGKLKQVVQCPQV